MQLTATLINYYMICHRKLWLHAHAIRMEHTSDVVYEGKLIGESTYPQRAERYTEVEITCPLPFLESEEEILATAKIDFYDPHLGVVHEVKKSAAKELAHVAQVQFYLYVLRKNNIDAQYGMIEYPKLRLKERVELDEAAEKSLEAQISSAFSIVNQENCPPLLAKSKCRSCSYFDFCWSTED